MNEFLILMLMITSLECMEQKIDQKPSVPQQIIINIDDHHHKHKTESPSDSDKSDSEKKQESCCTTSTKVKLALIGLGTTTIAGIVTLIIHFTRC